ncbi:MAG: site-specific integrase [Acidithiobacillus sp.]
MATFKQRESGWWQAVIRRRGHPSQSKTFENKRDAEAWARDIENQMDKGSFVSRSISEKMTMTELIDRFKEEFALHHYRRREDNKEAWRFQCQHLDRYFGKYSIAAVTPPLVVKYREARLKLVSGTTVRKEINMLSKILGVANTEFQIPLPNGNPVLSIRKPRENKSRDRRLSEEEFARLIMQCGKSRNKWLLHAMLIGVETAIRQAELLSLRWENIAFNERLAYLNETDRIKNETARAVPLSSRAIKVLKEMPRDISGRVIPLERMTLYHAFIAAVKRAGLEDFTWHDLRHEALSRLASRGDLSLIELAKMSGHKTLQMLMRYSHIHETELAKKLG